MESNLAADGLWMDSESAKWEAEVNVADSLKWVGAYFVVCPDKQTGHRGGMYGLPQRLYLTLVTL